MTLLPYDLRLEFAFPITRNLNVDLTEIAQFLV